MPLVKTDCEKDKTIALLLGVPFASAIALSVFRIGAWTVFRVGPGAVDGGIPFFAHAVQALAMAFISLRLLPSMERAHGCLLSSRRPLTPL